MKTISFLTAVMLLFSAFSGFASVMEDDLNNDGITDKWVESESGLISSVKIDRDYNGLVDYMVSYDENQKKIYEEMDFNSDGEMDDFYYYSGGKMTRREIDSNYDGKVDIWVFLDGIYIQRYEKDTDFDGVVDVKKDFVEE